MRADKTIPFFELYTIGVADIAEYINQLRYERLMAKARYMSNLVLDENLSFAYRERSQEIAEALEARARRIKEGM